MKSVLFTNHQLVEYAGSELVTLDLARHFQLLGWEVEVATFVKGAPLIKHFSDQGIKVNSLLDASIERQYDLIWAQHHPVITEYLNEANHGNARIIVSCLSPCEPLEAPPFFVHRVNLVLANSLETREELLRCGVKERATFLFPNSVPDEWFLEGPNQQGNTRSLKRVAVISNHPPAEIIQLTKDSAENILQFHLIGTPDNCEFVTPTLLRSFDAILTIGRTVQQALALRIPVFCYDRFGGPGWLTENNFDEAEHYNFSGRCTRRTLSMDQILSELFAGFSSAVDLASKGRELCLARYSLTKNVTSVLKLISAPGESSKSKLGWSQVRHSKRINETYVTAFKAICELRQQLHERTIAIARLRAQADVRENEIRSRDLAIAWLKVQADEKDNSVRARDEANAWLKAQSDERENVIRARDESIVWLKAQVNELENVIRSRDEAITWLKAQVGEMEKVIRARDEAIAFLQDELSASRELSP